MANKNQKRNSNIIGIGLLIAVASIVYSTVIIVIGSDGVIPKILVAPQAVLGLSILVWKFCRK